LGFQPIRIVRDPLKEMPKIAVSLTKSFLRLGGASLLERMTGLKNRYGFRYHNIARPAPGSKQ